MLIVEKGEDIPGVQSDIENQNPQHPTPTLRRPSTSFHQQEEKPPSLQPPSQGQRTSKDATESNRRNRSDEESPGRWHISSTFFNSANDLFFRTHRARQRQSDPVNLNPSELTISDDQLSMYLEGIKPRNYLPGWFCWIEKIILMIDFFQVFGIIWIAAQPWPWPYLWIIYTRPINAFNLDFFSFTTNGALGGSSANLISRWGQMDGYLANYAIYYAAVAIGLSIVLYFLHRFEYYFDYYGQRIYHYRSHLFGVLLGVSYLLYVPCSLAILRVFYCDAYTTEEVVAVDPTVTCLSTSHLLYMTIYGLCLCSFTTSLFYYYYYYVNYNLTYYHSIDHEKKLQIYELLNMWEITEDYLRRQVWILSSFRYYGRYFYLHLLLMKGLLLLCFIFIRNSFALQAVLMFLIIISFAGYYLTYKLPYRNIITNGQLICVLGLWILNISYGVCNAFQMVNVMTTASTQTIFMIAFHVVFFVIIFTLWGYILIHLPMKLDWPSIRTYYRLLHAPKLIPKVYYWLQLLREVEQMKIPYLLQPKEIQNLPLLEYCIQQIHLSYLQAKSIGSIFEVIFSEVLEELLWIHSQTAIYSYRQYSYWDTAYRSTLQRKLWSKQSQRYCLMNPKKRRILYKLLTYFLLRGGYQYQAKFDLNIALEYQQNQRLQRELKLSKLKELYAQKRRNSEGNTFRDFQQDFLSLMDGLEGKVGGEGTIRETGEEDGDMMTGWSQSQRDRFHAQMMLEAKKMIDRLQQRTELALNKHHHAAKAIQEQQKQAQLQHRTNVTIQETSTNDRVNNIIHQFNQYQAPPVLPGGGSQISLRGRGLVPPQSLGGSSQSLLSSSQAGAGGGGGGLRKITTMELIKETVDEEERQDLEELYYLWDEAINLYEQEEFPGNYEELNQQVENWYAYRELISKRLEIIVNYLREQLEMLDELVDTQIDEEDDEFEEGEEENHHRDYFGGGKIIEGDYEEDDDDEDEGINEQSNLLSGSYQQLLQQKKQRNNEEPESNLLSGSYVELLNLKKGMTMTSNTASPLPGSTNNSNSGNNNSSQLLSRSNTGTSNNITRNRNALSRTYQLQQQQLQEQQQKEQQLLQHQPDDNKEK